MSELPTALACIDQNKFWVTGSLREPEYIAVPGACPHCYILKLQSALLEEKQKTKELLECLKDCEDIFECEGITSLSLNSVLKKYGDEK